MNNRVEFKRGYKKKSIEIPKTQPHIRYLYIIYIYGGDGSSASHLLRQKRLVYPDRVMIGLNWGSLWRNRASLLFKLNGIRERGWEIPLNRRLREVIRRLETIRSWTENCKRVFLYFFSFFKKENRGKREGGDEEERTRERGESGTGREIKQERVRRSDN